MQYYDPFSTFGQYNIKSYLYTNKRKVLVILSIIAMIIIGLIISAWYAPVIIKPIPEFNIPQPAYGLGPFGEGLYLPPKEMLLNSIVY